MVRNKRTILIPERQISLHIKTQNTKKENEYFFQKQISIQIPKSQQEINKTHTRISLLRNEREQKGKKKKKKKVILKELSTNLSIPIDITYEFQERKEKPKIAKYFKMIMITQLKEEDATNKYDSNKRNNPEIQG